MEQTGRVEELGVELGSVKRCQPGAEHPGAVPVADQRGRLLLARLLDRPCQLRIGWLERFRGKVRGSDRHSTDGQLDPTGEIAPLPSNHLPEQPPALPTGQRASGPPGPAQAAETLGIWVTHRFDPPVDTILKIVRPTVGGWNAHSQHAVRCADLVVTPKIVELSTHLVPAADLPQGPRHEKSPISGAFSYSGGTCRP